MKLFCAVWMVLFLLGLYPAWRLDRRRLAMSLFVKISKHIEVLSDAMGGLSAATRKTTDSIKNFEKAFTAKH